ncbi:unnamed protein product, partial [Rotaria magnacalcarata]
LIFLLSQDDDDDEDDDDEDDDDEESSPKAPLKSALKKTPSVPTPTKQKPSSTPTKAAPIAKQETPKPKETPKKQETPKTPAADKPLNKTQLFINSIKESVSVSDMKSLYPKAKLVKMQKRKVGPNNKLIQFAFVTFENEADCADALKAHTQIGGAPVNVSYAFAPGDKQQNKANNESNKKQEQKPANGNSKQEKNGKQEKNDKKQSPLSEKTNKKEKAKAVKDFHILEKQLSTNSIYVGQLPEHVVEDDVKALFPKALKIELFAAKAKNKGVRPGFAFVTFSDDNSAAAAIKLGPSLTIKNTQLKVAYQTKRATPVAAE